MAYAVGCPCVVCDIGCQSRGRATGCIHSGINRLHAGKSGFDILGKSRQVGQTKEMVIGAAPFTNTTASRSAVWRSGRAGMSILLVDAGGPIRTRGLHNA